MEPFLYLRLPGESLIRKYNFDRVDGQTLVFGDVCIKPWPGNALTQCADVAKESTPRPLYIDAISATVATLKQRGGKTVIARTICGDMPVLLPEELMKSYFAAFPDMLCFMFYHPLTNYWMGASPELLLEADTTAGKARTRSLAGTRPRQDGTAPWSDKNIREHNIVTDDICRRINNVAPTLIVSPGRRQNLPYGNIEHLCTPIEISSAGPIPADRLINAIHPTPAICGFPQAEAMHDIAKYESEPRRCYAGTIVMHSTTRTLAYVILRCVHFNTRHYAIYTGSGITADSDPDDEWRETAAKAQPLLNAFSEL